MVSNTCTLAPETDRRGKQNLHDWCMVWVPIVDGTSFGGFHTKMLSSEPLVGWRTLQRSASHTAPVKTQSRMIRVMLHVNAIMQFIASSPERLAVDPGP